VIVVGPYSGYHPEIMSAYQPQSVLF